MKPINAKRERGAALLALLAVIMLGASWFLVSKLNAESGMAQAVVKARNAEVLARAKRALIGYIAAQAVKAGENRPGAFPCPEAPASFNDPLNEGEVSYPCTLPKVGRFPWKTLGLDKLVDASGEPLWYVVSPGWAGASTVINSNSVAQLTVDGVANDSVALIIAPGPAFIVAANAANGCAAHAQVRPTTGTPDWRNYLECSNATYPTPDATFATTGPSASFNDQVMRITVADIMPAIEAAIANRIEREIVPALKSVYTPSNWGFSGSNPAYPFAAPFSNPGPGAGSSNFRGAAGTYQGLLPFNYSESCNPLTDPRCTTSFVAWDQTVSPNLQKTGGSARLDNPSCSFPSATTVRCSGTYQDDGTLQLQMAVRASNVAMALRRLDAAPAAQVTVELRAEGSSTWVAAATTNTATGSLRTNGSATISVNVPLPFKPDDTDLRITIDIAILADHALLDPSDSTTGWFVRNEWYRLLYYAVARGHTAEMLPPVCPTTTPFVSSCLSVANVTPTNAQRAILILAGRSINGRARPSATLTDYFEFGNAKALYERQTVTPGIIASYVDTGTPNAYSVPVTSLPTGATVQFRALADNTGNSTLTTTATGTKNLVNTDGSNLAASTVQANAVLQVTWDGTKFLLSKRPFNDRVVAIDSN